MSRIAFNNQIQLNIQVKLDYDLKNTKFYVSYHILQFYT